MFCSLFICVICGGNSWSKDKMHGWPTYTASSQMKVSNDLIVGDEFGMLMFEAEMTPVDCVRRSPIIYIYFFLFRTLFYIRLIMNWLYSFMHVLMPFWVLTLQIHHTTLVMILIWFITHLHYQIMPLLRQTIDEFRDKQWSYVKIHSTYPIKHVFLQGLMTYPSHPFAFLDIFSLSGWAHSVLLHLLRDLALKRMFFFEATRRERFRPCLGLTSSRGM